MSWLNARTEKQNLGFIKFWLGSCAILFIGFFSYVFLAKQYTKHLFSKYIDNSKVYVYETYYGAINNVYYITDLSDSVNLIKYYSAVIKGDTAHAFLNFEIKSMPYNNLIYVKNFGKKGSNIVELIDFNTDCWGYIEGYVYKPTIHTQKAPEELLRKRLKLDDSRIEAYKNTITYRNHGFPASGYGCQCDNN